MAKAVGNVKGENFVRASQELRAALEQIKSGT